MSCAYPPYARRWCPDGDIYGEKESVNKMSDFQCVCSDRIGYDQRVVWEIGRVGKSTCEDVTAR
jgi:hypothetical protein